MRCTSARRCSIATNGASSIGGTSKLQSSRNRIGLSRLKCPGLSNAPRSFGFCCCSSSKASNVHIGRSQWSSISLDSKVTCATGLGTAGGARRTIDVLVQALPARIHCAPAWCVNFASGKQSGASRCRVDAAAEICRGIHALMLLDLEHVPLPPPKSLCLADTCSPRFRLELHAFSPCPRASLAFEGPAVTPASTQMLTGHLGGPGGSTVAFLEPSMCAIPESLQFSSGNCLPAESGRTGCLCARPKRPKTQARRSTTLRPGQHACQPTFAGSRAAVPRTDFLD